MSFQVSIVYFVNGMVTLQRTLYSISSAVYSGDSPFLIEFLAYLTVPLTYRKLPLKNTGDIQNLLDGTILVKKPLDFLTVAHGYFKFKT